MSGTKSLAQYCRQWKKVLTKGKLVSKEWSLRIDRGKSKTLARYMATDALQNLTALVIKKSGNNGSMTITIIMFVIAILSSPMGYNPFIAFVPVGLLVAAQLNM